MCMRACLSLIVLSLPFLDAFLLPGEKKNLISMSRNFTFKMDLSNDKCYFACLFFCLFFLWNFVFHIMKP